MKKMRLDLDTLSVESFGTTSGPEERRGTVHGHVVAPIDDSWDYCLITRRISDCDWCGTGVSDCIVCGTAPTDCGSCWDASCGATYCGTCNTCQTNCGTCDPCQCCCCPC